MKPIRFESACEDGLNVYRYLPGIDLAVEKHWPGLYEEWPETATPWTEYAVSNNNSEEIAVYVGLVWRLTDGLDRQGIPNYYRDEASDVLDQVPTFVDWEYEIDAEALDLQARDKGFVPGRSCISAFPEPTVGQAGHAGHAGVFNVAEPRDLVGLLHATLLDASAEVTLFAVDPGPDRLPALVRSLTGPIRPSLATVLRPGEVFVDMSIGVDLGFYDSITVASQSDLTAQLQLLTDDYHRRIADYETKAGKLADIPAFLAAMPALTGINAPTPSTLR